MISLFLKRVSMKPKNATKKPRSTPQKRRIVLVLQGGGALGAYQAGFYHALMEG